MLVCFEGEELFFAGDDDLVGWLGTKLLKLGRGLIPTVAYR